MKNVKKKVGDKNYYERSLAILEKTLASEVPFFVPHITDDNLRLMTSIVGTLSKAAIPRLHVRSFTYYFYFFPFSYF